MRYRKLDQNGDIKFGNGLRDFYIDVPDAPAQAIKTRLLMWEGEWFLDPTAGTPWDTKVLGKYTAETRDPVIRGRIIGTMGVSALVQYSSYLVRDDRSFAVQAQVNTDYGITNATFLVGEPGR